MEDTRISLDQFIGREGLTSDVTWADDNPNMDDMPAGSTHYRVTIRRGDESMVVPFSMGPAHTDEPSLADVLNCLADDSAGYWNARDFADWCAEYGYDEDSRRAFRTYEAVKEQSDALRELLGEEAFETLLWETERL